MSEAVIYISAFAFLIYIFPVNVFSYVYITTQKGYISANVSLFKLIPLYKGSTKLELNLKSLADMATDNGKLKLKYPSHYVDLYNKLCITKIIQFSDFGLQNQANAYAILFQHMLTQAVYSFVKVNGGRTKLKNYVVINGDHDNINYCLKVVGVINLMALVRLFIVYFWSVINERKIKKIPD